jgi:hypothetical protein
MRFIDLEPFPQPIDPVVPPANLIRQRLSNDLIQFPPQAVELLGVMAWPNDQSKRARWVKAHVPVSETDSADLKSLSGYWSADRGALAEFLPEIRKIQKHWARVADIVHLHFDLDHGGHQRRRGGVSVGKAIALVSGFATSKGTGDSRLWEFWKRYKDSAHLIAAAVLISAEANTLQQKHSFLRDPSELQPYRVAMLMPDLVLSVGMAFEKHGLGLRPHSRDDSMLATATLWQVPKSVNLRPMEPPVRRVPPHYIALLAARRAGNRGKANRRKTTPVSG